MLIGFGRLIGFTGLAALPNPTNPDNPRDLLNCKARVRCAAT
jgi:hypothetical protein